LLWNIQAPLATSKRRKSDPATAAGPVVCTESLNPGVMVMKSTKDGMRFDASCRLNRARDRRIFVQ
jgi:hypothetical protein